MASGTLMAAETFDMQQFLQDISDFTTRTNVNIDYQPSVLTVLYGEDLEALGVQNVYEALDFVPGIETVTATNGTRHAVVRGANQPYNMLPDKLKLFVDGVDMSAKTYSTITYFMYFPIELIARIEVLRGAASAIYGQGAFNGAVNIVTKSTLDSTYRSINFQTGSYSYLKGSTVLHTQAGGWHVGMDAYYQRHDRRLDAPDAPEAILLDMTETFAREKETLEGLDEKGIGLNAHNDEWTVSARYLDTKSQNYYGFFGLLDHNDEGYTRFTMADAQLAYEAPLGGSLDLHADVGIAARDYELNTYFLQLEPNDYGFTDPHYRVDFSEQTSHAEASLQSDYFDDHLLMAGAYFGYVDVTKVRFLTNHSNKNQIGYEFPPGSGNYWPIEDTLTEATLGARGILNMPDDQVQRSYYLQDLYHATDTLDFALNLRLDDYDYFDPMFSWRFASVYSADGQNIFKLIYARAYRVPSFSEAFTSYDLGLYQGNPDLEPERVDTFEASYVFKRAEHTFRANAYYSVYQNMIDAQFGNEYNYHNCPEEQYGYGAELEYSAEFPDRSKLFLNLSYTLFHYSNVLYETVEPGHSEDPYAEQRGELFTMDNPNISPWIAHAAYIYPVNAKLTWSNLARFYSEKELLQSDETVDAVLLWDTSLAYRFERRFKTSLTVKNLFDTDNYSASGIKEGTAPMPREGRIWLAALQYYF